MAKCLLKHHCMGGEMELVKRKMRKFAYQKRARDSWRDGTRARREGHNKVIASYSVLQCSWLKMEVGDVW